MVFEYIIRKNGLDPQKDLTIDQSIDFGSTAAAFTGDKSADFTVEFEPSATALEKEGAGYVVASLGVDSGYVPYTSYSAKTRYMEKNPEIIQKFTNALQKGMEYVQSHTPVSYTHLDVYKRQVFGKEPTRSPNLALLTHIILDVFA